MLLHRGRAEGAQRRRDEEGPPPGYDGRCRDLTPAERGAAPPKVAAGSIRFRTPDDGTQHFVDAIRGEVSVEWSTISDFVIVRSNGTPVFFLANAVDDIDMGITHVLRGEDLIDSTHRVLALRRALGATSSPCTRTCRSSSVRAARALEAPRRGLGRGVPRRRVSCRRDRELPRVARLGARRRARGARSDELVAEFDVDRVNHSAAAFDAQKLEWMNGEHIRRLPVAELAGETLPFAKARYGERLDIRLFEAAVQLAQERSTTLVQIAEQAEFLFVPDDEFEFDGDAVDAVRKLDRVDEVLDAAIEHSSTASGPTTASSCGRSSTARAEAEDRDAGVLHGDQRPHAGVAGVRVDRDARS